MRRFIEDALRTFAVALVCLVSLFIVQSRRGEVPWQTAGEAFVLFGRYALVAAGAAIVVSLLMQVLDLLGLKEPPPPKPLGPIEFALGLVTLAFLLFFLVWG